MIQSPRVSSVWLTVWACSLMAMSEFEREEILAQRLEQLQRIQDKRNLEKMVKDQSARAAEVDSVSKAAKRLSYLWFSPLPR